MRLTLEALGHVLTVTLEQPVPEPDAAPDPQPGGDVYAAAERRGERDLTPRPIGFGRRDIG